MNTSPIDRIAFGGRGAVVTRVGLGGEGILRTHGRQAEASAVIEAAVNTGIAYFDSARVYASSELYLGGVWKIRTTWRGAVFQASKSAGRSREQALQDLDETLDRLGTDCLDLWQIHDIRTDADIAAIEARDGALAGFIDAREDGRVRHIGVTGHHDPRILSHAVRHWPVDAVMMPVNPVEGVIGGFMTDTLAAAREKKVAVIGMKVLGAGHYVQPNAGITAELLVRYALSRGATVAIAGCSTPEEVHALAEVGRGFSPLPEADMEALEAMFAPQAKRLAFYRPA